MKLEISKTCSKVINVGSKRFPKVWNDKKWCPFIFEDKNWLSYDRKCLFWVFNVQGREMRIFIKIPLNLCAYILSTWGTKGFSFSFSHSLAGKIKWKIKKHLNFGIFRLFWAVWKKKKLKYATFQYFRLTVKLYRKKYIGYRHAAKFSIQDISVLGLCFTGKEKLFENFHFSAFYGPPQIAFF